MIFDLWRKISRLKMTRMRVLCRKAELIPVINTGRKSNDQRMPSGDATTPPSLPPSTIPYTMLSG